MSKTNIAALTIALLLILGAWYAIAQNDSSKDTVFTEDSHNTEAVAEYEIHASDVFRKIQDNEDIVLLDVRTLQEHEVLRLQNSLLLPVQTLNADTLTSIGLGDDAKDKEIIIYCRSGNRSKAAYDMMSMLGYTNVKSMANGINDWLESGYTYTESGPYTGPMF